MATISMTVNGKPVTANAEPRTLLFYEASHRIAEMLAKNISLTTMLGVPVLLGDPARIRTLNDQLRQTHVGGRILMSRGVMAMGPV